MHIENTHKNKNIDESVINGIMLSV